MEELKVPKRWLYLKRGIAAFLTLWGTAGLLSSILVIIRLLRLIPQHLEISFTDILITHHAVILRSLLTIVAGVLLWNKRVGILLSFSAALVHIGYIIKVTCSYSPLTRPTPDKVGEMILISGAFVLLFVAIIFAITRKQILIKNLTLNEWLWILTISVILILDSFILKFF